MERDKIITRIEEIAAYIKEDYQFDNIDIILHRSKSLLSYQADIPSLINQAQRLRDSCDLKHITEKVATRKIFCAQEYGTLEMVKNTQRALSQASRTTQSQLATLRAELIDNLKSR